MKQNTVEKLVIIGSGPAGLTASVYAARANLNPVVIEGTAPGGQLMGTTAVENWPGEKSIMGPKLMMQMREHAQHFGTRFVAGNITKVDFTQKPFTLWTSKDKELKAESVIIATGAEPKRLGCLGENEYWGKGVTTCAVCDGAFYPDKEVVIVGGGDTATVILEEGLEENFDFISTGGGAMLEFLVQGTLPGIDNIIEKEA